MAQPTSYLELLRDLSLSPDEKKNGIKIKGYRTWENFFTAAERLKNQLRRDLENGNEKPAEIVATITRYNALFRKYSFEGRQYTIHDSFKFTSNQARFVVSVHQFYQPLRNYNDELMRLCQNQIQAQQEILAGKNPHVLREEFILGMRIQINPINFFSIFQQLAEIKFNGMDIVKLENKRVISRCLSLFCADNTGKQIPARTIEKYLTKSSSTSSSPSNPPHIKITIPDK